MDDSCIDNSVYSSEYEGFSVEKARLYCAISLLLRYAVPVVRLIIYFSIMYLSIRASGSMMSDSTVFTTLGNLIQFVLSVDNHTTANPELNENLGQRSDQILIIHTQ